MRRRLVFTLVELLVVVAILGILMALALSALGRARASARRIGCLSCLKQLGVAIQAYEQGNGGFFPFGCTSMRRADPGRIHLSAVLGMVGGGGGFRCPAEDEGLHAAEGSSYVWNWTQIELPGNGRVGQRRYDAAPYGGMVPPEDFAIMIDAGPYHGQPGQARSLNALYADGSVADAGRIPF